MKVADLDGADLDYWVARAMKLSGATIENDRCWIVVPGRDVDEPPRVELFSPSTTWAQCGPIMEKLCISTAFEPDSAADAPEGCWEAYVQPVTARIFWGETPLVAGMRAAVNYRFGSDISG